MEEKTKGGNATPETSGKGKHFSNTYQVLEMLIANPKGITAVGLNRAVGFNDARKKISDLREQGYPIRDWRLPDNRKVYFLPFDWEQIMSGAKQSDKQLELF